MDQQDKHVSAEKISFLPDSVQHDSSFHKAAKVNLWVRFSLRIAQNEGNWTWKWDLWVGQDSIKFTRRCLFAQGSLGLHHGLIPNVAPSLMKTHLSPNLMVIYQCKARLWSSLCFCHWPSITTQLNLPPPPHNPLPVLKHCAVRTRPLWQIHDGTGS